MRSVNPMVKALLRSLIMRFVHATWNPGPGVCSQAAAATSTAQQVGTTSLALARPPNQEAEQFSLVLGNVHGVAVRWGVPPAASQAALTEVINCVKQK